MDKQEYEALRLCVASLDQLLPHLARVPADIGLLNEALMAARPLLGRGEPAPIAQAEQQPVAWRWMYDGKPVGPYAFNYPLPDDDVVWRGLEAERPHTVQPLYAAPIAQTEQQRED